MSRANGQGDVAEVYVVDDDASTYELLRRHAPARWFHDADSLLRWLDACEAGCGRCAVVVVEARLGGADGIELIDQLRSRGWPLPVIVVCREADVSTAVHAMQHGAADFFARPLPAGVLLKRIRALRRSR